MGYPGVGEQGCIGVSQSDICIQFAQGMSLYILLDLLFVHHRHVYRDMVHCIDYISLPTWLQYVMQNHLDLGAIIDGSLPRYLQR
jgi:hypothetical protein